MALPTLEPIRDSDLPAFCQFLNEHLSSARSAGQWAEAFLQNWGIDKPNNGFLIRDQERVVGGIGAIYAERMIRGRPERFCNITSWCVLEEYRAQSMRLAMAVVSQPGFHFTDLTPTEVVSKTLQFLKFKPMNERQAVWPNFPWPFSPFRGVRVITGHDAIEAVLAAEDAKVFRDHRRLPWLRHAAVGRPGAYCHVVWKPDRLKGVPGAMVLAFSDAELFLGYRNATGAHLLMQACFYTRVESRLLPRLPVLSLELAGFRNKVFHSDTLAEADISNLYSEIVGLDL
ncbi:MAG: hypothetical protein PHY54_07710 [Methylococcales bacterium]|nr:hypothetical protein [Methylococcales bacterium]